MELALKLASIFFTMILVDNYVLAKFLGICPFLGVSKKLDSAVGMVPGRHLRHGHGHRRHLAHLYLHPLT